MTDETHAELPLATRLHALALLAAIAIAAVLGDARWLSAIGVAVFGARILAGRPAWREAGFGLANALTAVRILGIAALPFVPSGAVVPGVGAIIVATFALDGIDGWVARKLGTSTPFGADFDLEADAYTVALTTVLAHEHGLAGAWFLVPGILRYAYVVAVWLLGAPKEAARSRLGRHAYSLFVVGLIALWILPGPATAALAAIGTTGLVLSFATAFRDVFAGARRRSRRT